MKPLLYFPTLVLNFLIAHLTPKWAFRMMRSSSVEMQEAERPIRNAARLADYHAKRLMGGEYPLPVKEYYYPKKALWK